jgi:hypothetical protein
MSEAERFRHRADSLRARAAETTDAAEYEAMALTAGRDDRGKAMCGPPREIDPRFPAVG